MMRLLAEEGRPVAHDHALDKVAELGIDRAMADAVLDAWTERNDDGDIVGFGITYNPTPHQMTIDGVRMWAWCGMDTLIFAHILDKPINTSSTAPGSGDVVTLQASPAGITDLHPASALATQRVPSRDQTDLSTKNAIWGTFCHHNFFFPIGPRRSGGRPVEATSPSSPCTTPSWWPGTSRGRCCARNRRGRDDPATQPGAEQGPGRRRAHPPPARRLHRLALTAFNQAGRAPLRAALEQTALDHGVDPGPALSELIERDVLAVDEPGEIRAAYPFSPVPTRHRVTRPSWPATAPPGSLREGSTGSSPRARSPECPGRGPSRPTRAVSFSSTSSSTRPSGTSSCCAGCPTA
jgi:hypothetical protein